MTHIVPGHRDGISYFQQLSHRHPHHSNSSSSSSAATPCCCCSCMLAPPSCSSLMLFLASSCCSFSLLLLASSCCKLLLVTAVGALVGRDGCRTHWHRPTPSVGTSWITFWPPRHRSRIHAWARHTTRAKIRGGERTHVHLIFFTLVWGIYWRDE
jgi:hypothetical protein